MTTRCPIPEKRKDLTPKQIETIYKNWNSIKTDIYNEAIDYKKSKSEMPKSIDALKKYFSKNSKRRHLKKQWRAIR